MVASFRRRRPSGQVGCSVVHKSGEASTVKATRRECDLLFSGGCSSEVLDHASNPRKVLVVLEEPFNLADVDKRLQ